jgi:hypothetical protein
MEREGVVRFACCGEPIGAYEPIFEVTPEGMRSTSLARELSLTQGDSKLLHADCAENSEPQAESRSVATRRR